MKTILLTGINGFLGSNLAKRLVQNFRIIGMENSLENLYRVRNNSYEIIDSTVESIRDIFTNNRIDIVLHTATIYSDSNTAKIIESNILLPLRLLVACKEHKTKYFINTDSFFNNPKYEYKYLNDYTLSKKHALQWLIQVKENVSIINMKLEHVYGPLDSAKKFVPYLLNKLVSNVEKIELTEGLQKRDFIFIDDVVSAYEAVIRKIDTINNSFVEIPVGFGKATTLKEFVNTAKLITGSKTEIIFGAIPYRDGEIMKSKANTSYLFSLGWKPRFTIEKGLSKILNEGKIIIQEEMS